jgi:hypothetical protein
MNHDALLQLLRTRPTVDRVLDSILAAGAEDGRTTVDDILADGEVPRRQAIILLRDLESFGYGAFKVGRKGHPSRFEWSIDPADLEAVLEGEDEQDGDGSDDALGASVADDDESATARVLFMQGNQTALDVADAQSVRSLARHSRDAIDHAFVLRPDCRVTLALPDNLTRREAEVLADWVRNLSFER